MNTATYYLCKRLFSIVLLLTTTLLLTACAGQQAAKELTGLEIASLLEYKKTISQSIASEENYYKKASNLSSNYLSEMKKEDAINALNYQAKFYNHLWQKTPPSRYNVLELIDAVYGNYEKTNKELDTRLKEIDELYFSKTEKLTLQQDNINKSIEALTKLYMGDDLKDQADLVKDYIVNTAKSIGDTAKAINKAPQK